MKPIRRQVYGYSAGLESLMQMIKEGKTQSSSFRYAMNYLGLSDDEAWQCYLAWSEGKLHPVAKKVNQRIYGIEQTDEA